MSIRCLIRAELRDLVESVLNERSLGNIHEDQETVTAILIELGATLSTLHSIRTVVGICLELPLIVRW